MLAEDQNKKIREKLQAFDRLPEGFDFSSDRVWQQLEIKLQQKKKPSGMHTYSKYMIAASFILAISLMSVLLIRKEAYPTKTSIVAKKIPVPIKIDSIISNGPKIHSTIKVLPNYLPTKKDVLFSPVANTSTSEPKLVVTESNQKMTLQPVSETTSTITSSEVSTEIEKKQPILKNRLPIIHINELGRASETIFSKSNIKNNYLNEVEESPTFTEHPKSWWQPKPKTVNPIISLTDNQ